MSTRNKILKAVLDNQPPLSPLPELISFDQPDSSWADKFAEMLISIGGQAYMMNNVDAIAAHLPDFFDTGDKRIATTIPELSPVAGLISPDLDPHSFADIELMIMKAHFGVAENGAVWITEALMGQRILPFIPQHLAVVLQAGDIVPTMHQAYERIGDQRYRFGSFISGPSKTADIEQALVLGAHGPRTMTAFIIK